MVADGGSGPASADEIVMDAYGTRGDVAGSVTAGSGGSLRNGPLKADLRRKVQDRLHCRYMNARECRSVLSFR